MTLAIREHPCEVERWEVVQLPLLRHGGYGAAVRVEIESCACGSRLVATEEQSPRERSRT